MGEATDQALTRVEDARAALEADVATLLDRLPAPAVLAGQVAAGGGGALALALGSKVAARRRADARRAEALADDARIQARAIAAAFAAQRQLDERAARAAEAAEAAQRAAEQAVSSRSTSTVGAVARAVEGVAEASEEAARTGRSVVVLLILALVAGIAVAVRAKSAADEDALWDQPEG